MQVDVQYRLRSKVHQLNRYVYYSSFSSVVRAIAVLTNLDEKKNGIINLVGWLLTGKFPVPRVNNRAVRFLW